MGHHCVCKSNDWIHDCVFFFLDFDCYSNEHCNSHGSCNNQTGQCACDTKWKDSEDCSGDLLMLLPNFF